VIGVVTEVGNCSTMNTKFGPKEKRTVTIADDCKLSMNITFWGPMAENLKVQEGQVVAIKGAKVSDFNGKSLNCGEEHA